MRINKYIANCSGMSRRQADNAISNGEVKVNGLIPTTGQQITIKDKVSLNGNLLTLPIKQTIILNKPVGYVVSRNGQGSKTIYDLLPKEISQLKPIGRLDKNSSGLILLTNDGYLAEKLTHPKYKKEKIYLIELNKNLEESDRKKIEAGVLLEDGLSKLILEGSSNTWQVTMSEGRNRQIRRTFSNLGYEVIKLHRIKFGDYILDDLRIAKYKVL